MRQRNLLATLIGGAFFACLVATPAAFAAGGDVAWSSDHPAQSVDYHGGKVFAAGVDFFDTGDAVITAYRAGSGEPLWDPIRIPQPVVINQVVARGNTLVVVGNVGPFPTGDFAAAAFDVRSGELLWFTAVPSETFGVANSAEIIGNRVVATGTELADFSGDDALGYFVTRGFDLKTGDLVWTDMDERYGQSYGDKVVAVLGDDDSDSDSDSDDGLYEEDDDDDGALVIAYGLIADPEEGLIAAPEDGRDKLIRAYNPKNGDIVWSRTIDVLKFEGGIDAFAVEDEVAYFAFNSWDIDLSSDGIWQAGAVDTSTGALMWLMNYNIGFPYVDGLAVQGDRLVVGVDCTLVKLETETGAVIWDVPPIDSCPLNPAFARGRLVTSGFAFTNFPWQNVTAYKPRDGTQTWTTDLVDELLLHPLFFSFNVGDSIATGKGLVFVGGVAVPGGFDQLRAYEVR